MLRRYQSRRSFLRRLWGLALGGWVWAQKGAPWPKGMELLVTFRYEGGGFRYRAPYVAVYVEDPGGNLVRTLALFLMPGKGQRWWKDLRRYYGLSAPEAMATLSGPTRPPGEYTVAWDGRDERGQVVSQGRYFVCVEYVREHGPYELFREAVVLETAPFAKTYPLGGELREVRLAYQRKA